MAQQTQETHPVTLSDDQQRVLMKVCAGQNVFFTGPAGTGKSLLLRTILQHLRLNPLKKEKIAITASTGIAGLNIGGSTVHSFAGVGLGKEPKDQLVENIMKSRKLKSRWTTVETLIIDEISMLDGTLFDKLEHIARVVRNDPRSFGGIQLVLSGDFFQLPPVPDRSYNHTQPATFIFEAKSWLRCIERPVFLSQIFRQRDDTFIRILTNIRHGIVTLEDNECLRRLERPLHYSDGIEPSQLFPIRKEVEECNNSRLADLPGRQRVYYSMDSAGFDVRGYPIPRESAQTLLERLVAPPTIALKVGAQVMLIQNIEQRELVNGSLGKVVEFLSVHDAMQRNLVVAELSGRNKGPAAAAGSFHPGDDTEQPINGHIFGHREIWPLVQFENGRELLCSPLDFTVEGFLGNTEARRVQVPLILAWAISIHKSQGQTLSRVRIDLGRVFERGQAYVAISRATTMDGLEIANFHPSRIQVHPRVLAWHQLWTPRRVGHQPALDDTEFDEEFEEWISESQ